MYYSRSIDPIFHKLHRSCITALDQLGIRCVEQLFGLEKKDLLNLNGIGPKKADEILNLLHDLPFDYMSKDLPGNPEKDPYLGLSKLVAQEMNALSLELRVPYVTRGFHYFIGNSVESVIPENDKKTRYKAKVRGSRLYEVKLSLILAGEASTCSCPYVRGWGYSRFTCKHVVAALLQIAYEQRLERFGGINKESISFQKLNHLFKKAKPAKEPVLNEDLKYVLTFSNGVWNFYPQSVYEKINRQHPGIQAMRMYGYDSPWKHVKPGSSKDKIIVRYLRSFYEDDANIHQFNFSGTRTVQTVDFADIFTLIKGDTVALYHVSESGMSAYISPVKSRLGVHFSRVATDASNYELKNALRLTFSITQENKTIPVSDCQIISGEPCWVYYNGTVMEVDANRFASGIVTEIESESITIPENELPAFFQELFPTMAKSSLQFTFEDGLCQENSFQPVPRLYLSEKGSNLIVALKFSYGNVEVDRLYNNTSVYTPVTQNDSGDVDGNDGAGEIQIVTCSRDSQAEDSWIEKLHNSGLTEINIPHHFIPEFNSQKWVMEELAGLSKSGFEIYGEDKLKKFARPKKMTSRSFQIKSGENWFELVGKLNFEGFEVSLKDIQDVLIPGSTYVKLSDNRTGELPDEWLKKLKKILHLTDSGKEKTQVPKIMANQLEELLEDADSLDVDEKFESYVARLQSFEKIEESIPPEGFKGELRAYQKAGLSWLGFLRKYEFGGILADDMGLGKTIQVLAFIQKIREDSGEAPKCLIVAPRSVIQNWEAETSTFVSELGAYVHHGPDRPQNPEDWPDASLVITTYTTLRIDIEVFKEIVFDLAVLDESHSIRNPASQTFKAIRLIKAKHRLCLSGTPVQNTVMDLWTQFHFLNPGLIGSQAHFLNHWVKPIEKYQNKDAGELLQKMVAPFILRRTKKKVAKDLPSLTSSIVHCPMEISQQTTYEKHRKIYYDIINKSIDEKGVRESRFAVLEGLLRLRQISCSPQLIKSASKDSSKVRRFLELAEELISEGHRALVFSQFVQFLKILEVEVKKKNWTYEYLDGSTKKRQEKVDRFQNDSSVNLFLISLKAGGEGLNLTAADYVFIMDPWWNPAAERRAMDRTHRIGQTENVFVYRLVCPDTVEEKILKLQERKQKLSDQLITSEAGIFKELNRDELIGLFE